jgi:hypothetical protein
MRIIDVHTHAFPDSLAERAMPALEKEGNVKAVLDGKVGSLLASMDAAGIEASVVASIATRPQQFRSIFNWSREIATARMIPFPSVHPADPAAGEQVREVHAAGFKGIKLHPYYQEFKVDEPRLDPVYTALEETGLILLCHAGFDLAFPRDRKCDPVRVRNVIDRFPRLKLIAAHLGGWEDWDEVEKHLLGLPLYMDVSYSIDWAGPARAKRMMLRHPHEYLLFGTDSPWAGQAETMQQVRELQLGERFERLLLGENAARLLALPAG